jgi:hypothetical protein
MSGKTCLLFGCSMVLCLSFTAMFSCSNPEDPFLDPVNVTLDLILPDTADQAVYTLDSTRILMVVTLASLIDSIVLSIEGAADSVFPSIKDTIPAMVVFNDSGDIAVKAMAYCKKGVIKQCEKTLIVHKNPLVPPDTVQAQTLTDTSINLYWKSVNVAKKYRIYRCMSGTGTFSPIETVEDTLFLDAGLSDSTVYYYKVSSIDSLNRESDLSSPCSATTFAIPQSTWDEMVWDRDTWE